MRSRYLTPDELSAVFSRLEPSRRLLFEITLNTGLRIGDACKVRKSDLTEADGGRLLLKYEAEKTGKRGIAVLTGELADKVRRAPKGRRGFLFPSDRARSGHVTRQAAWLWFKRAAKDAGVDIDGVSPHALRKNFAVEVRHRDGLEAARELLQHDRAATTSIYAFSDVFAGKADEPILWTQVDELVELVAQRLASEQKKNPR